MAALERNINEVSLGRLARQENYTFFGLTLPYLVLVGAMIVIPIGWFNSRKAYSTVVLFFSLQIME